MAIMYLIITVLLMFIYELKCAYKSIQINYDINFKFNTIPT